MFKQVRPSFLKKRSKKLLSIWLEEAALALGAVENPRREARLLAGVDRTALLREPGMMIDAEVLAPLLARRVAREPLALILGRQDFWTGRYATSPATLVPRADSESLIEAALAAFPRRDVERVLDLGTGTGCLLLAALGEFPQAFGVGVDRVAAATRLAADNARTNELADRAAFLCGDWGAALAGRFDLILCNPPYVRHGDMAALMPEVALYEPASALDGGMDGLAAYRRVVAALPSLLKAQGVAIVELGAGQAEAVLALAAAEGLVSLGVRDDLGGIPRALTLRREAP